MTLVKIHREWTKVGSVHIIDMPQKSLYGFSQRKMTIIFMNS